MFNRFYKTDFDDHEELRTKLTLLGPQIDQLKDKADAERVEKQTKLLPQLGSLAQQRNAEIPVLQAEVQELSDEREKLQVALQEVTKAWSRAAGELSLRSSWFDHQQGLVQSEIYELASPVIAERQKKWRRLIDEARLKVESEERATRPNVFGQWNKIITSNVSMINQRVNAITAAIKAAEEMKIQPLPECEIIEKLDALEKTFPPLTNDRETITVKGPDTTELRRVAW